MTSREPRPKSRHLVLELDQESAGVLAGALLSGDSCAIRLGNGRLVLRAQSDASGARLDLREG